MQWPGFTRSTGEWRFPTRRQLLDDVLQAQAEAGIAKTVLCSAATVPHQVQHINEFLARKAAASGGVACPLAPCIRTAQIPRGMWSICWSWD